MTTSDSDESWTVPYRGKSVLITGASGFLGRHLIAHLPAASQIHAVSRSVQRDAGNVRWHRADLADSDQAMRLFQTTRPDIVFHMTSDSRGGLDLEFVQSHLRNDVAATVNCLVAALRTTAPRFVFPGSMEEPTDDEAPYSPYSAARMSARLYAQMFQQAYGLPLVIATLFMTYGPEQKVIKLIPYTICCFLNGERPQLSSGERLVDWIYVDDAIAALLACGIKPHIEGCVFEVGSGTLVSIRDLVNTIHALIPSAPLPNFGALPDRGRNRVADIVGSRQLLAWRPVVSLETGLQRTIDYYRDRGT